MVIKLQRIKKECFDELKNIIIEDFKSSGILSFNDELVEEYSAPLIINGKEVELEIDIVKYEKIVSEDAFVYTKMAKVGMELQKDFESATEYIPRNIYHEKEFWAYLSLTLFKDVVKGLRASLEEGKISADKIKQYYFNIGETSRTGLLFVWVMVDQLDSNGDFDIIHTAFEFVDPVKAILERTMSKNPQILRAFVEGIIRNGKNSKFKSKEFKSKMPSHISCYASVSVLDALEYSELVDVIAEQQKAIITNT